LLKNANMLSHHNLRIVHGKGTVALRQIVRDKSIAWKMNIQTEVVMVWASLSCI